MLSQQFKKKRKSTFVLKNKKKHKSQRKYKLRRLTFKEQGHEFAKKVKPEDREELLQTYEMLKKAEIESNSDRIEGMEAMLEKFWKEIKDTEQKSNFLINLSADNPNYVDWVYKWKGRLVKRVTKCYKFQSGRQWVHQNRAKFGSILFLDMLNIINEFVIYLNMPDGQLYRLKLLSRLLCQKYHPRSTKAEDTLIICPVSIIKSSMLHEKIELMSGLKIDKNVKSREIADQIDKHIRITYKNKVISNSIPPVCECSITNGNTNQCIPPRSAILQPVLAMINNGSNEYQSIENSPHVCSNPQLCGLSNCDSSCCSNKSLRELGRHEIENNCNYYPANPVQLSHLFSTIFCSPPSMNNNYIPNTNSK